MRCLGWFWLLLSAVIFLGCGSSGPTTARVTGKITIADGTPLPGGRIDFKSASSGQISGVIKADGTYEALGVPLGAQEVSIHNKHLEGVQPPAPGEAAMPGSDQKYVPIDAKYSDPKTSGLTTTVTGVTASYDVKLQ